MSTPKLSKQVVRALEAAWEAAGGQKLSADAAAFVIGELSRYPEEVVLKAIARAAREVTGRLSLAAIIQRIDDGRPTAEEAWAQVGTDDENVTFVTTTEAMAALGQVRILMQAGDLVAARMAFKAAYERIVTEARGRGAPPVLHVSAGHDKANRARVLMQAAQAGRITAAEAALHLDGMSEAEIMGKAPARLEGERRPVAQLVGRVAKQSGPPPCSPVCDGWRHADGSRCPRWP